MAHSMTGFARSETSGNWGSLAWEARSVNHRYLDVRLKLPDMLRPLEQTFREAVAARISRGKVELNLKLQADSTSQTIEIDHQRLAALGEALAQVQRTVTECNRPDSLQLLHYPGVLQEAQPDMQAIQEAAQMSLQVLLDDLQRARNEEGERLARMLRSRAEQIAGHADGAAHRLPQVRQAWESNLRQRLAAVNVETDPARLEQEIVLNAQRMDVAEELDRVHSHIDALEDALAREGPIGRRLDFLMQEFNREANTLSSKSQDAELTNHAVEMKVLIEQMREQVQNIE